ncbi:MAG: enoyl-CoA hydratase-related protein [Tissierellia bacterium]|nr:enoyl-CoA hydratase-related protein [Tissierellia bacterium]
MDNILLEKKDGYAILTINRPKALNALNSATLLEIQEAVKEVESDDKIKAVILTGSGEKAFVAGADISEMSDLNTVEAYEFGKRGQETFSMIENSSKFYIAAVNGFALGGGCEISMSCDMRLASDNAKFGIPEVTLGVIPGFGGTQRLPKLVGLGRAKEMLATGGMIKADKAEKWGLVNSVYSQEDLLSEAEKIAAKVAKNSSYAVAGGLEAMNQATQIKLGDGLELEALLFAKAFSYPDQEEGMKAFLEKRQANFK